MGLYDTAPLTVGAVLMICTIGFLFGVMFANSAMKDKTKKKTHLDVVDFKNLSSIPQIVKTTGTSKVIKLEPGESSKVTISSDATLETESRKIELDGNRIHTVYFTGSDINTNRNASIGIFSNTSNTPVRLVEIGRDGNRWSKGFVGPKGHLEILIPDGTLWQVVDTERSDIILGTIKSSMATKELVYNGEQLTEIR